MESIRRQRNALRTEASAAMGKMQQLEFEMIWALERIVKALGLEEDVRPNEIAKAVEGVKPLLELEKKQTENIGATYAVLAENGLPSVGIVDGVRALAGRAQTALQDQKVLAERLRESLAEGLRILQERDEAQRISDAWANTAREILKGEQYYRGLLVKIGSLFGVDARTADDGTVGPDVLVAKVPELVEQALAGLPKQVPPSQVIAPSQWRRSPGGDCLTDAGFMHCWYRPDVGLRWCIPSWNPTFPGIPGESADWVMQHRVPKAA